MTAAEKVAALLAGANTATGSADADLTAAVNRLIDGYGGGGSADIDTGTFTPASGSGAFTLNHNLGVVPDLIIAFNTTCATEPVVSYIKIMMYYKPFTDTITGWEIAGISANYGAIGARRAQNGAYTNDNYGDFRHMDTPSSPYDGYVTDTTLYFTTSGTAYAWETGATYRWFAIKFPAGGAA